MESEKKKKFCGTDLLDDIGKGLSAMEMGRRERREERPEKDTRAMEVGSGSVRGLWVWNAC